MSHTYAILELSKAAVDEIRKKLADNGYDHAFHGDWIIDMHGIAVSYGPADKHPWRLIYPNAAVSECPTCGIQRLDGLWRKTRDDPEWRDSEFPVCDSDRLWP
jgi:hypothetical protein